MKRVASVWGVLTLILGTFIPLATVKAGGGICGGGTAPGAYFSSPAYKGLTSLEAAFDASSSDGCGDQIVSYSWDFGDGALATGVTATHTYGLGTFNAMLTVVDEAGLTDTYTRTYIVKTSNQAPVATDDNPQTDQAVETVVNVAANDSDPDDDALAYTITSEPAHGFVYKDFSAEPGGFIYHPDYDFHGTDSFTYQASDGFGGVATAVAYITVRPNVTAHNDYAVTDESQPVTVDILANDIDLDGDTLIPWLSQQPTHGRVTFNQDGSLVYTPNAGVTGEQSFVYKVSDSQYHFSEATVHVTVNAGTPPPVNTPPVAQDDATNVSEDGQLNGNVLANDSDADQDPLSATRLSNPSHGTLLLQTNGTFTYTPYANWSGTDSFTYRISDGRGGTSNATVTIVVQAVNDGPTASFTASNLSGRRVVFNAANSADMDGTIVNYAWNFGDGSTGTGRSIDHRYRAGTYTATLTVYDDQGASAVTTQTITVQ